MPASAPRKGASSVRRAKRIGGDMLFAHGSVPFTDGVCTFRGWQHLIFGWKRRCADVRAGTQAPPLRLSLSKLRKINLRLAGGSANGKKIFWDLPAVRQTLKKDFGTCREFGKRQKNILGLAGGSANGKKRFGDLPRVRQTAKKDFETCRRFGKR